MTMLIRLGIGLALALASAAASAATITDDFNRTNSSTLGANWTVAHGNSLEIIGNTAENSENDASYDGNFHVTTLDTADQYVEAVIGGVGANNYFDLKLRRSAATSTSDGYQIAVGASNELYITRIDDGSGTDLATGSFSIANGDVIRGEIEGSTIRLLINGVQRLTAMDGTYSTGAFVGIGIFDGTDTSPNFDSFEAGDLDDEGGGGVVVNPLTGRGGSAAQPVSD